MQRNHRLGSKNVQKILEKELARLKKLIPFGEDLAVIWRPLSRDSFSGEVVGNKVLVYDLNMADAVRSLRHEYLDYVLTRKLVDPLIALVNAFIHVREREIYAEKERVIACLEGLI